jgi:hypothetical protein
VSAGSVTARSTLAAVCGDRVRAFQHALYRAAKADPGRRFHALFDKVYRRDVLDRAWEDVRRNRGAAGIDRVSLADVEEYGVTRLLGELAAELRQRRRGVAGTPQGGVISPLLCNAYLHRLDRAWRAKEHGVLVRYADDVVVMCDTREQAEAALAQLTALLAGLGLEPKAARTRIVHLAEGSPGFDFLGFHHRLVRGWTPKSAHLTFLARWPSRKAAQHARDRIREITGRDRLLVPVEVIVTELNLFLRGWAGYFRYGNSARVLGQVGNYALWRLGLWLSKKGNRRHGWRWGVTQVLLSPDHLGLASLHRIVIPPRPFRDWRGKAEYRR